MLEFGSNTIGMGNLKDFFAIIPDYRGALLYLRPGSHHFIAYKCNAKWSLSPNLASEEIPNTADESLSWISKHSKAVMRIKYRLHY